jgi:hypothetical protein
MKYLKGDIVEIITAKYKSWNDIPGHEQGCYENQRKMAPFIGQRFRVSWISDDGRIYSSSLDYGINSDHLMLYKRPFKNWIKITFHFSLFTSFTFFT